MTKLSTAKKVTEKVRLKYVTAAVGTYLLRYSEKYSNKDIDLLERANVSRRIALPMYRGNSYFCPFVDVLWSLDDKAAVSICCTKAWEKFSDFKEGDVFLAVAGQSIDECVIETKKHLNMIQEQYYPDETNYFYRVGCWE